MLFKKETFLLVTQRGWW